MPPGLVTGSVGAGCVTEDAKRPGLRCPGLLAIVWCLTYLVGGATPLGLALGIGE
jgi:hypothetical protein